MSEFGVLQEGHQRRSISQARARRARRRRRLRDVVVMIVLGLIALLVFMVPGVKDPSPTGRTAKPATASAATKPKAAQAGGYHVTAGPTQVNVRFAEPPRAALLFDIRSGHVMYERNPTRKLPIASLTKMMTALVAVAHSKPTDSVLITTAATHFSGSGIGLLPVRKHVPELPLLYGLMLPSGNDAAIALAQHVAGSQARFVAMMNAQARSLGLRCTHFDTVSGIIDRGNYSCADDLAVLAHAVLEQPLLRKIVGSRRAILPFPIKAKKLYLYNNNPLMYLGYRGIDGVKTGYTVAAGSCLVASARRGRKWFGAVVLHSVNSAGQTQKLLNAAFAAR
jgi:D-alanyl-D-alanine carboxypeptidase